MFFDTMILSWYNRNVMFVDPLTSLLGMGSYRNNMDMLMGRTLMEKLLFDGTEINLHLVTGGEVTDSDGHVQIDDIITK